MIDQIYLENLQTKSLKLYYGKILKIGKNEKLNLGSLNNFKKSYEKDCIVKIIIESSENGFLKIGHHNLESIKMINNDSINSINIAFYKGSSERYLQLDPIFSLNDLTFYHNIEDTVNIRYLAIKLLDNS